MNLKILSLLAGSLVTAGGATTAIVISKNKEVKSDEEITSSAPSDSVSENNDGKDSTEKEHEPSNGEAGNEKLDTNRTSTTLSNPSGDEEQGPS